MRNLFQNKFFIICLCVAVVLAVVPSTFALMGYGGLAKNILGTVTFPVRWCFSAIADGFEGWSMYFESIDALKAQNDALESENRDMADRLENAELLENENERLRAYLGMKSKYPSFTFEEGMVISYSSGNYITTLTLNKGSIDGIEKNMPVVTPDGIVGYVSEVGLNWCMVSTLIETATSVGAYIPRSGEVGIVSGDYSMRYDGLCKVSYVNVDADIEVGDTVLSSGTGSVYPAGLEIGTVTAIDVDEYSRTIVATVKPSVEMKNMKWVMIITDYETETAPDASGDMIQP